MRIPRALLILMCFFTALRCNHSSPADDPEMLSNLRFAPGAFDSFTRNTELKFTLRHPVTVDITIERRGASHTGLRGKGFSQVDALDGHFVAKTLIANAPASKGSHSIAWLGDTDAEV